MTRKLVSYSRPRVLFVTFAVFCLLASLMTMLYPQVASAATVPVNFDRANGGLGSNWTTVPGTGAPQIVSNILRVKTTGALNSAYWSASTFSSDQFAQASLPNSSGTQYGPGIAVRLNGSKGYFLWYGNSSNTVSLWRMDSSSSRYGWQRNISAGSGLLAGGAQRSDAVIYAPVSARPSPACSEVGWFANPA